MPYPPGAPGRVVNLLESECPDDVVWGVAYEIPDEVWKDSVEKQLDHREKGGYTRHTVKFHTKEGEAHDVTIYLGSKSHRQYAGPDAVENMAKTIATSVGPSGKNTEYLFNLADALKDLSVQDDHVEELTKAVREYMDK